MQQFAGFKINQVFFELNCKSVRQHGQIHHINQKMKKEKYIFPMQDGRRVGIGFYCTIKNKKTGNNKV